MAFTPISGKNGSFNVGATAYAFGKWTFSMKTNLPKVTNFTGSGYRQLVSGITEGTINAEGPYDQGNMPFTSGASYTVTLHWNNSTSLSGTAYLESIDASQDVDDAARVKLTFQTDGAFTAAIT